MKYRLIMFVVGLVVIASIFVFSQKSELKPEQNIVETESGVPLPQKEDVIRVFFGLIDEGRVSEAVMMMSPEITEKDSEKQSWGVMWNAFEDIKVTSVELAGENIYKVVLETKMKSGTEDVMPIPFYGYGDGEYVRFVGVEKTDEVWKIKTVATGP